MQQYNALCRESGFVPMARSILVAILNVCSASTRNSIQGLDYFTAQGAKAFEHLQALVERSSEFKEFSYLEANLASPAFKEHLSESNYGSVKETSFPE